jgi:hypothetical protein
MLQAEEVEAKKMLVRGRVGGEWEYTVALQKYTPVLRARGILQCISFFIILIGFKGLR